MVPCMALTLQKAAIRGPFFTRQIAPVAYLCVPSMSTIRPFLYVKSGCPWCAEAEEYLRQHKIAYDRVDVNSDAAAFEEMKQLSGQTKAPTMRWDDEILADFGADELDAFLRERNIVK